MEHDNDKEGDMNSSLDSESQYYNITDLAPLQLHNELFNIQLSIISELEMSSLLKSLVNRARSFFNADLIVLFLYDVDKGVLLYETDSSKTGKSYENISLMPGEGAAGMAFIEKRSIAIEGYRGWDNRYLSEKEIAEANHAMAVPLYWGENEMIGALTAARFSSGSKPFSARSVKRLEAFGLLASIAIRNARDREMIISLNERLMEQSAFISSGLSLTESMLYQRNQELMESLKKNERIQSEERRRIANDMHDDVLQLLYGANNLLEAALNYSQTDPTKVPDIIASTKQGLAETERSLRGAIHNLRHSGLEKGSFIAGLINYAKAMSNDAGLSFSSEVIGEKRLLGASSEMVVLRIIQEAIQNTIEHAHADSITLTVHYQDEQVCFLIEDDGIGVELTESENRQMVSKENHYGMQIMYERSEAIGAQLRLQSRPGVGMGVALTIPYTKGNPAG